MTALRVAGPLDPCVGWDGVSVVGPSDPRLRPGAEPPPLLRGLVGTVLPDGDAWRIVRDPLGLAKLFWAPTGTGLLVAARPHHLIAEGASFEEVQAVPRATVVDIEAAATRIGHVAEWVPSGSPPLTLSEAAVAASEQIHGYVRSLPALADGAPAFVCMSGGVDSTVVTLVVQQYFPDVRAVSFDLLDGSGPSTDRRMARVLAAELGIELLEIDATIDDVLDHVDTVLREGVDWRPFNVHAGLVNAVLADAIRAATGPEGRPVVFTGDLANELLADYDPVEHEGVVHYRLPAVPQVKLQRALVRGLEACHREVGVFGAWGLVAVQPFSVAADAYLRLPGEALEEPHRKTVLGDVVAGTSLPGYVRHRAKVRAQVGSDDGGGVLAACIERGVGERALADRFAQLHDTDDAGLRRFLTRAGIHRSRLPGHGVAHAG